MLTKGEERTTFGGIYNDIIYEHALEISTF